MRWLFATNNVISRNVTAKTRHVTTNNQNFHKSNSQKHRKKVILTGILIK